jgi:V-type H+-transporting ATPase subunit a
MWIKTNTFTAPFQLLNDSYGFADYDKINGGAFYSMYTFLFRIMFGDV